MNGRLCVVGAGPAGEAASRVLAAAGAAHDVFDENPRAGGNVDRRPMVGPPTALESRSEADAVTRFEAAATVIEVRPGPAIVFARRGRTEARAYDAILICTGARDGQFPRPGLRHPGCTTAGALQALLKGQGLVPEGRVVLCGGGPFLHVAAADLAGAGANVRHVIDRVPVTAYAALLRTALAMPRLIGIFARAQRALLAAGAEVRFGAEVSRIEAGAVHLVGGPAIGFEHAGISDYFAPESLLARTAGCTQVYARSGHYFATRTDASGRTDVPGVFVCGEGQGVRGRDHAALSGALAALACLDDRGAAAPAGVDGRGLARAAERHRRFAEGLERILYAGGPCPPATFADGAEICACEGVPVGRVREAVGLGLDDLASIKSVSRCGMGPCQGRYCEPLVCRMIEAAEGTPRAPLSQRGLARPMDAREFARG